jgi:folate-binding protein YgfZ
MSGPLVMERSRGILRVTGRDPIKMIHGLATADIEALTPGRGAYTAFLTPKGRMVADARVFLEARDPPALLLDVALDALPHLADHLARFVPPLFARAKDVTAEFAVIGVYGEDADEVVSRALPADPARGPTGSDDGSQDAEEEVVPVAGGFRSRTAVTGGPGWDVFVDAGRRDGVVDALLEAGGRPGDPEALEALRIAAGRPRWGRELTEDVIPLEAGLLERAISQTKGCYTGQEVIVRILHRGHVNRHLRRLEFAGPVPEPGTELFEEGREKPRGIVTSAVENEVGALGLGYVRREVEPPAELRVGSPDGDPVQVTSLE